MHIYRSYEQKQYKNQKINDMANSWVSSLVSHPIGARFVYYPTLLYGILRETQGRHWYNRIDNKVLLGALPLYKKAKEIVEKENVGGVITLNENYETRFLCPTTEEWNSMNVRHLRIPTVDFNNAPTLGQIHEAIAFIDEIEPSKSIYVHCKAGRSRSSVVVISYLMAKHTQNVDSSIEMVKEKRPHIVLASEHIKRLKEFSKTLP